MRTRGVVWILMLALAAVGIATAALEEWGIEPRDLAEAVFARVEREEHGIRAARAKVRAKGEA